MAQCICPNSQGSTQLGITKAVPKCVLDAASIPYQLLHGSRGPGFFPGYCDTRKFLPIFTQILPLARSILERQGQGKSTFTCEMQVVSPPYTLARRCSHSGLCREAISLLFSYPRREGLWYSMLVGSFAEWVMHLEEENFEGEYAPDHLRCKGVDIVE